MTIICAVKRPEGVWIASDSLVTGGNSVVGYGPKWAHGRGVHIGITGPYEMLRAVEHHIAKFKPAMDEHELWKTMRRITKDMGCDPKVKDGDPPYWNFSALFVTHRRVVSFGGDGGGVSFDFGQFAARGSGCSHAEGAWSALNALPMSDATRMRTAVKAACDWDTSCGGRPYVAILTSKGIQVK